MKRTRPNFTELISTRLIFTKEAYRAAPFSLHGTTFVLFNYIVPKSLKPTIYMYIIDTIHIRHKRKSIACKNNHMKIFVCGANRLYALPARKILNLGST